MYTALLCIHISVEQTIVYHQSIHVYKTSTDFVNPERLASIHNIVHLSLSSSHQRGPKSCPLTPFFRYAITSMSFGTYRAAESHEIRRWDPRSR